ncbi:hypothetical protein I633_18200 [Alteromonas mediterranea 615]|jgi:hypothetical protein|uniref:Sulfotransferase n=1 Tax=Alteromonas mediterranea 615 TaxID=1300253 RepID=S5AQC9_9ALTE|nr:hypothetical protein I633_18200 [Alteromonas mediterranea 615]
MDFQLYKKMLRDWAFEQKPVFIMGPERSGTSLLFQQVSNHPDFCDFSHATVETFCFIKPWLLLEAAGPENYEMRVYLGQKNFEAFQKKVHPLIERNKELSAEGMSLQYLNNAERKSVWFERRYKHLLRAFFYNSWLNLGEKLLVEKTPAHIRCAEEILGAFPNAKLLICTRDPAEIIASHRKRYKKEIDLGKKPGDKSIAWLNHSTFDYLKYFSSIDNKISFLAENHSENFIVVPYGQLTSDPELNLRKVFEFIGVDNIGATSSGDGKANQAWDPLLNQAPQKNIIDFSEQLDSEEIELIKAHKPSLMNSWI